MFNWWSQRKHNLVCPAEALGNWIGVLRNAGFSVHAGVPSRLEGHEVYLSGIVQRSDMSQVMARINFSCLGSMTAENGKWKVVITDSILANSLTRLFLTCGFVYTGRPVSSVCLSLFRCKLDEDLKQFFATHKLAVFPDCLNSVTLEFAKPYWEDNWQLHIGKSRMRVGVGHTHSYGSYFAICNYKMSPDEWKASALYKSITDVKARYHWTEIVMAESY